MKGLSGKSWWPKDRGGEGEHRHRGSVWATAESADDIGAASAPAPAAAAEPAKEEASDGTCRRTGARVCPCPGGTRRGDGNRIFASPLARRIAADKGLDLSQIKGSGPKGRIVKADVENAQPGAKPAPAAGPAAAPAAAPSGPATDQVIKPCSRAATSKRSSWTGCARPLPPVWARPSRRFRISTCAGTSSWTRLLKFRSTLNKQLEARGVKLSRQRLHHQGLVPWPCRPCRMPMLSGPGDRILKLAPSDVAVAVAIEGGLFTPVLKDSPPEVAVGPVGRDEGSGHSRPRPEAGPHEYQGGSFAISNLGMFGIDNFDAVINPPHGSILAVGAGVKKPVVKEDGDGGRGDGDERDAKRSITG